ncbi:MAG: hypothetical protein B6I26_03740 [Desulfobacteraceae bacterium 4572_130]|nr:MAG: hypothetical protein B6I26_03740 [Desulfobacteraceae bacterium 4572_130]
MENKNIIFIDETIREGMQHRGLVFSYLQRKKILEFQEALGIDICQAGYPCAHKNEAQSVKKLNDFVRSKNYKIKIEGMGRAYINDVKVLIKTGIKNFHLHGHIPFNAKKEKQNKIFSDIKESIKYIREKVVKPKISIAMLDIGKTDFNLLEKITDFFINKLNIEILSLPDTSGFLTPNLMYDKIKFAVKKNNKTKISIHCHNDMGMACANTFMGIFAGADIVEASVFGIGERNGIADIFTMGNILENHGFKINLKIKNTEKFKEYYEYINKIYKNQTNDELFNYNTPFFGNGVKTHVAGTHNDFSFGITKQAKIFLNLLCGKKLVKKYLESFDIPYKKDNLENITNQIKSKSAILNRRLFKEEIKNICKS